MNAGTAGRCEQKGRKRKTRYNPFASSAGGSVSRNACIINAAHVRQPYKPSKNGKNATKMRARRSIVPTQATQCARVCVYVCVAASLFRAGLCISRTRSTLTPFVPVGAFPPVLEYSRHREDRARKITYQRSHSECSALHARGAFFGSTSQHTHTHTAIVCTVFPPFFGELLHHLGVRAQLC